MDNLVLIAAVDAQHAAEKHAGEPLEARARAAMEGVQNHWMVTDENKQFLAACEGLARTCSPEERERVEGDLRKLARASQMMNALQAGVPVDFERLAEQVEEEKAEEIEPLGLQRMWREVVDACPR